MKNCKGVFPFGKVFDSKYSREIFYSGGKQSVLLIQKREGFLIVV